MALIVILVSALCCRAIAGTVGGTGGATEIQSTCVTSRLLALSAKQGQKDRSNSFWFPSIYESR